MFFGASVNRYLTGAPPFATARTDPPCEATLCGSAHLGWAGNCPTAIGHLPEPRRFGAAVLLQAGRSWGGLAALQTVQRENIGEVIVAAVDLGFGCDLDRIGAEPVVVPA